MKPILKILGIAGAAFCLCGLSMLGIGYATGGADYIKPQRLDLKSLSLPAKKEQTKETKISSSQAPDEHIPGCFKLDDTPLASIDSITANLSCIDFRIKESEDHKCHLSYELYCQNKETPLTYQVKNGMLILEENGFKEIAWKGYVKDLWDTDDYPSKPSIITLYVPSETILKSSTLNMGNGDLMIQDLHCDNMILESEDGDMFIQGSGKNISVKTQDGDISLSGFQEMQKLQIDTVDGDVNISNFDDAQRMRLSTVGGDISLSNLNAADELSIDTEDGDIHAAALTVSKNANMNTTDGDVDISKLNVIGNLKVAAICGDVSMQARKECLQSLGIILESEEGDISAASSLGGKKNNQNDGTQYQKQGIGNSHLTVSTEDGDIALR